MEKHDTELFVSIVLERDLNIKCLVNAKKDNIDIYVLSSDVENDTFKYKMLNILNCVGVKETIKVIEIDINKNY